MKESQHKEADVMSTVSDTSSSEKDEDSIVLIHTKNRAKWLGVRLIHQGKSSVALVDSGSVLCGMSYDMYTTRFKQYQLNQSKASVGAGGTLISCKASFQTIIKLGNDQYLITFSVYENLIVPMILGQNLIDDTALDFRKKTWTLSDNNSLTLLPWNTE